MSVLQSRQVNASILPLTTLPVSTIAYYPTTAQNSLVEGRNLKVINIDSSFVSAEYTQCVNTKKASFLQNQTSRASVETFKLVKLV